uniref:NADH dehydrogenase subunit 6 n=1 Tax=Azygia robusta TaxID=3062496 RepID=A0AA50W905_9TREM|nr:NADH dehydrogenase subunit 6 [Azygia robusta]WMH04205.1 NADH dehydrogenase subunit 6 [Azygia robusta]WMH04217.1 NADH dehydrogenase subunit 6 [Azygia robusta]
MSGLLLSVYFSCLVQFSFVTHPVTYCGLLLLSSLSGAGYCVLLSGLSWYVVLFCLVYVGGIYILFIFVSVQTPNPTPAVASSGSPFFFSFLVFMVLFSFFGEGVPPYSECSHYLCSFFEGFTYCLFCFVLVLGFVIISGVVSSKGSFYR